MPEPPVSRELVDHFCLMARYNRLANARLYDACQALGDVERRRDRGAFFGSIHNTLNHILLGDRLWLTRLSGGEAPRTPLDTVLYDEFDTLRAAREAEDVLIERFVGGLDPAALKEPFAYVNYRGVTFEDPLWLLLPTIFNHQTHHRGQVHDMLSQAGVEPPSLDLHRVLKPEPGVRLTRRGARAR